MFRKSFINIFDNIFNIYSINRTRFWVNNIYIYQNINFPKFVSVHLLLSTRITGYIRTNSSWATRMRTTSRMSSKQQQQLDNDKQRRVSDIDKRVINNYSIKQNADSVSVRARESEIDTQLSEMAAVDSQCWQCLCECAHIYICACVCVCV